MNLVSSTLYFEDTNTNIIFLNNTATDVGGATHEKPTAMTDSVKHRFSQLNGEKRHVSSTSSPNKSHVLKQTGIERGVE